MATSYFELEKQLEAHKEALANAAMQVETMGAIIGVLLEYVSNTVIIPTAQLRKNHDTFNVIVTPNGTESITITLKEKDAE
jgi:hypothetical protein